MQPLMLAREIPHFFVNIGAEGEVVGGETSDDGV